MKRTRAVVLGAWLCLGAAEARAQAGPPAGEPAPVIERIEVLNNQFLQRETLLYYISTKPGDPYDERKLREDFKRLWDTGFLDDLQIEVVDGQGGKVVRFKVTERKRIQIVDYRGSKELTTSTIEDALKKADAQVKIDTFYDPTKARKVESIIKEMLAQKGRPFGSVKHEAKNIGGSGQQLSFIIDEGPKAKVHEIVFDGNQVFADGKLAGRMKKVKEPGFFNLSWLGGKTTYTEDKWLGGEEDPRGDRGRLEDFYLDHGYVTARIGQPRISYTDGKSGFFKKKPIKLMRLEIPVSEGAQYRMGELKFEGLTVLKEEFVRTYFKMKPGDVYNDSRFKKAYEKLRDVYGSLGYFQWTGGTQRKPDPEKKVVDITVKMEEDKQYFVGRINFTGNDSTRDKVIRREIYMNEGEVFNTEALKMSIKRVNQLGYFKPMEGAPDIRPSEVAENKVDVTFKVEEQNRNQFTFGGGVSGLEGTFINASFSTTNFLGAGETFQIYAQSGKRTKNYSLSVSEPYFLDRPITAGVDLFKRKITYLQLRQRLRLHPGEHRGEPGLRLPGGKVVAGLPELHVRGHQALRGGPRRPHRPLLLGAGRCQLRADLRPAVLRRLRRAPGEPDHPEPRLQHRGQPLHPACRDAPHGHLHVRRRPAGGHGQLLPAQSRSDLLSSLGSPHVPRRARGGGAHPAVRGHEGPAAVSALFPGRRDPGARLQHPLDRPHRLAGARARRQQVRPLQR